MAVTRIHYLCLVVVRLIGLHYLFRSPTEDHGPALSLLYSTENFIPNDLETYFPLAESAAGQDHNHGPPYLEPEILPEQPQPPAALDNTNLTRKANGVIVILARNSDLSGISRSISEFEDKFNRKFGYPYVFLNEQPFSKGFKQSVAALTGNKIDFGLVPPEYWYQPEWIDEDRATWARNQMVENNVIYGGSVPYRNMCRFNTGFFYRHELLQKYRYYWRIEPDVRFFCTMNYDPFLFMHDHDKKYGFTLALPEYASTIPTLWDAVKDFMKTHQSLVSPDNALGFLSDDGGETYNNCAFWSNFEIADLDLWRGEAYTKFFEYLDGRGGFYYERWRDNTIHSIAAALFTRKDQIHFFEDIGYRHEPFQHCPQEPAHTNGECECDKKDNFDYTGWSCLKQYERILK
ncbi:glycosyltransferase family 15 protein [Mycena sanguinolenta]|nr:glycosyltransferase family 15 protein [Mycena sanguinolenta]